MSTDTMPTMPVLEPAPPAPPRDEPPKATKSKRPTTRAGRAQAAAEKKAKRGDSAPKSSTPRQSALKTRIGDQFTSIGLMLTATGAATGKAALQADGLAVIQHGPTIADALDKLAKDDPRVRMALERALTVTTWGALVSAVLPLGVTIAANHGVIPAQLAAMVAPGQAAPDPETLANLAGMMPQAG